MSLSRKILLVILGAILYCAMLQYLPGGLLKPAIVDNAMLQTWFEEYNESYYNGRLPKDTRVFWADLHSRPNKAMGETTCSMSPENKPVNCTVRIDPLYNNVISTTRETLLHETCHVATYAEDLEHGPRWRTCIDTLWVEGAFKGII